MWWIHGSEVRHEASPSSQGAQDSMMPSLADLRMDSGRGIECLTMAPYSPYSAITVLRPQHFSLFLHLALRFWNHTCHGGTDQQKYLFPATSPPNKTHEAASRKPVRRESCSFCQWEKWSLQNICSLEWNIGAHSIRLFVLITLNQHGTD